MDKKILTADEEVRKRVASIVAKMLRNPETPKCVKTIAAGILSSYKNKKPGKKERIKENNGPSMKKSPEI